MALEEIPAGALGPTALRSAMSRSLVLFMSQPAAGSPLYSSLGMCLRVVHVQVLSLPSILWGFLNYDDTWIGIYLQ